MNKQTFFFDLPLSESKPWQEGASDGLMSQHTFTKTLTRYGLELSDKERNTLFEHYDTRGLDPSYDRLKAPYHLLLHITSSHQNFWQYGSLPQ